METNPDWQLVGASSLAAASRVLKEYNPSLAKECLDAAEDLYRKNKESEVKQNYFWVRSQKLETLIELVITTGKSIYKDELCTMSSQAKNAFPTAGWNLGRVLPYIDCSEFKDSVYAAAVEFKPTYLKILSGSPFDSPMSNAEFFAFQSYYLHKFWPDLYSADHVFSIVNYMLGCKPGRSTNSLVSGVGVNSPTIAYGANRADWSYIPGGTFWNAVNLVNPDLAEDKTWPFLWQEREYIITAPCAYMFSVLGVDKILSEK
jgi:endoglucanase